MEDERLFNAAKKIQGLFRRRLGRKAALLLADAIYRKCYDESSGEVYYFDVRTGESRWDKPAIFGSSTVKDFNADYMIDDGMLDHEIKSLDKIYDDEWESNGGQYNDNVNNNKNVDVYPTQESREEEIAKEREKIKLYRERRLEGEKLIQDRVVERKELEKIHRRDLRQVAKRNQHSEKNERREARKERNKQILEENQKEFQSLYMGEKVVRLDSIREACLKGDPERVLELLKQGYNPNAESAMGSTPLIAGCRGGNFDVVRILLDSGAIVNHQNKVHHRSAFMEACSRSNVSIVRELLRKGAIIELKDAEGHNAKHFIRDESIRVVHDMAASIWSIENGALFPTHFRMAGVTLALIGLRQREHSILNAIQAIKSTRASKKFIYKEAIEAKVRHDESKRVILSEITLQARTQKMRDSDEEYDATRSRILKDCHNAFYSGRHLGSRFWFSQQIENSHGGSRRRTRNTQTIKIEEMNTSIKPSKLCPDPTLIPNDIERGLADIESQIDHAFKELETIIQTEESDPYTGVSKNKITKESQAVLEIGILEGRYMPRRPNPLGEIIDAIVKVCIVDDTYNTNHENLSVESDPRFSDEFPVWDQEIQISNIPSIHGIIRFTLLDHGKDRVNSGGFDLALRSLIDQKTHENWMICQPTIKQQAVEKKQRETPAELRITLKLLHTKSIVVSRHIQKLMQQRQKLIDQRREYIQNKLDDYLNKLENFDPRNYWKYN